MKFNGFISFVFLLTYSIPCLAQESAASQESVASKDGLLKDERDGQEYKTVKIGNTVWMAENMSYAAEESWCYTRFNYDCRKYGRYYNWESSKNACPAGWRLPKDEDFEQLIADVGDRNTAGEKLKSTSGWSNYGDGVDEYGFNALPAGFRDYRGRFDRQTMYAYFWTSTEMVVEGSVNGKRGLVKKGVGYHMMAGRKDVSMAPYGLTFGLSVRCVKDPD